MIKEKSKTIHQWLALNGILKTAKIIGLGQCLVILLMSIFCLKLSFQDPLVVFVDGENKEFLKAKRQSLELSSSDIESFIKSFIQARYSWERFERKEVLAKIRPFVQDGLYSRLSKSFKKSKDKGLKGKSIRQVLADIQVNVSEKSVSAGFFKILLVEGIPLPMRSELVFELKRGTKTKMNPFGIYINGVIEHNEEKQ